MYVIYVLNFLYSTEHWCESFAKILTCMFTSRYRRSHVSLYAYNESRMEKVVGRGGIRDGGRVAHSVHGKHAVCLWRWFLEVAVVARTLLFQSSQASGCWRHRDAESVKNWTLKETYTVEITIKDLGEIEFLQTDGWQKSLAFIYIYIIF